MNGNDLLAQIENENPKLGIYLRNYLIPTIQPRGRAGQVLATPPDAVGNASLRNLSDLVNNSNPPSATYVGTNNKGQIVAAATPQSGITQLTGDVNAGPGGGSQVATVVGIQSVGVSATAPTSGQVLKYDGTVWVPEDESGGMANPMTATGDLIVGGSVSGGMAVPARLAAGTAGQVLTSNGPGVAPSYQPAGGGFALYFGEGSAVALGGELNGTFGSQPMFVSAVSMFKNGDILTPATDYTVDLANNSFTLTSALAHGDVIVAQWATSNSNPGSIALNSPAPVSGYKLWFKADAITGVPDGLTITTWPDSSGNSNNATVSMGTATYHTNQINGLPAVTLSGCMMALTSAVGASSGHTAFVVFSRTGVGVFLGSALGGFAYKLQTTTGVTQGIDAQEKISVAKGTTIVNTGAWYQANAQMQNQSNGFIANFRLARAADPLASSTSTSITAAGPSVLGADGYSHAETFAGQIAEILYYDRMLSGAEVATVENYLNAKYGV